MDKLEYMNNNKLFFMEIMQRIYEIMPSDYLLEVDNYSFSKEEIEAFCNSIKEMDLYDYMAGKKHLRRICNKSILIKKKGI